MDTHRGCSGCSPASGRCPRQLADTDSRSTHPIWDWNHFARPQKGESEPLRSEPTGKPSRSGTGVLECYVSLNPPKGTRFAGALDNEKLMGKVNVAKSFADLKFIGKRKFYRTDG